MRIGHSPNDYVISNKVSIITSTAYSLFNLAGQGICLLGPSGMLGP